MKNVIPKNLLQIRNKSFLTLKFLIEKNKNDFHWTLEVCESNLFVLLSIIRKHLTTLNKSGALHFLNILIHISFIMLRCYEYRENRSIMCHRERSQVDASLNILLAMVPYSRIFAIFISPPLEIISVIFLLICATLIKHHRQVSFCAIFRFSHT